MMVQYCPACGEQREPNTAGPAHCDCCGERVRFVSWDDSDPEDRAAAKRLLEGACMRLEECSP